MKPALIFKQYTWLVNCLLQEGPLTFKEIGRLWVDQDVSDGQRLSRTTFNRHRDAILDMFGLIIDCNRSDDTYYISNPEAVQTNSLEHFALSSLTVGNVMASSLQVQDRIILEDVPSGEIYLSTVIRAIKLSRRLRLHYQRFDSPDLHLAVVDPYALKLFQRRWYLLAYTGRHLATYSLDRVKQMQITDESFTLPKGFSARDYYADYFGVWAQNDAHFEHITLRAWGTAACYLRTLPLHHSQREVAREADHSDFTLSLKPTPDFITALLAQGTNIEVLTPATLRQAVASRLLSTLKHYQ